MKVCYLGRRSNRSTSKPVGDEDVLELQWDNWDDFGFKCLFHVVCRIKGEIVELGSLRLLISERSNSHNALDELLKGKWDGTFPPPEINFISVPMELSFYKQLVSQIGRAGAIDIAKLLNDASFSVRVLENASAIELTKTEGFRVSLQRERTSVTAFLDGWKILENQAIAVNGFQFHFKNVFKKSSTLSLNFAADSILPHEINVLIGPNGVGKSQVLHQIVRAWNNPSDDDEYGFATAPNLNQVVVVSYSPFERFPVDLEEEGVLDKNAYRYFGLRGRPTPNTPKKDESVRGVRLGLEYPKRDSAISLISCLIDDQRYKAIRDWARKINTMESVLRTAFQFDYAAIEINNTQQVKDLYSDLDEVGEHAHINIDNRRYIPIDHITSESLKPAILLKAIKVNSGVVFFKDAEPIELSSGQRLFAYIVINLLGIIRRNSLILIDEPELFLHPTLEIQFIEMLKEILASFNSKALLATHSEVIVREIPADAVHVFHRAEDDLAMTHPPFQTFGGDIQRISSYVFGDNNISKPFEKWLKIKLEEYGSATALIQAIGEGVSEEVLVQIKAMERINSWL